MSIQIYFGIGISYIYIEEFQAGITGSNTVVISQCHVIPKTYMHLHYSVGKDNFYHFLFISTPSNNAQRLFCNSFHINYGRDSFRYSIPRRKR